VWTAPKIHIRKRFAELPLLIALFCHSTHNGLMRTRLRRRRLASLVIKE
jgi:hypothetical protein